MTVAHITLIFKRINPITDMVSKVKGRGRIAQTCHGYYVVTTWFHSYSNSFTVIHEVVLTAVASDGAVGLILSPRAMWDTITQLMEGDALS